MFNSHWQQLYKTLGFAKLTSNFNQCFFSKWMWASFKDTWKMRPNQATNSCCPYQLTGNGSTCRIMKWSDMDRQMAPINHMFLQGGMRKRDWFSDTLKIAKVKITASRQFVSPRLLLTSAQRTTDMIQMKNAEGAKQIRGGRFNATSLVREVESNQAWHRNLLFSAIGWNIFEMTEKN